MNIILETVHDKVGVFTPHGDVAIEINQININGKNRVDETKMYLTSNKGQKIVSKNQLQRITIKKEGAI